MHGNNMRDGNVRPNANTSLPSTPPNTRTPSLLAIAKTVTSHLFNATPLPHPLLELAPFLTRLFTRAPTSALAAFLHRNRDNPAQIERAAFHTVQVTQDGALDNEKDVEWLVGERLEQELRKAKAKRKFAWMEDEMECVGEDEEERASKRVCRGGGGIREPVPKRDGKHSRLFGRASRSYTARKSLNDGINRSCSKYEDAIQEQLQCKDKMDVDMDNSPLGFTANHCFSAPPPDSSPLFVRSAFVSASDPDDDGYKSDIDFDDSADTNDEDELTVPSTRKGKQPRRKLHWEGIGLNYDDSDVYTSDESSGSPSPPSSPSNLLDNACSKAMDPPSAGRRIDTTLYEPETASTRPTATASNSLSPIAEAPAAIQPVVELSSEPVQMAEGPATATAANELPFANWSTTPVVTFSDTDSNRSASCDSNDGCDNNSASDSKDGRDSDDEADDGSPASSVQSSPPSSPRSASPTPSTRSHVLTPTNSQSSRVTHQTFNIASITVVMCTHPTPSAATHSPSSPPLSSRRRRPRPTYEEHHAESPSPKRRRKTSSESSPESSPSPPRGRSTPLRDITSGATANEPTQHESRFTPPSESTVSPQTLGPSSSPLQQPVKRARGRGRGRGRGRVHSLRRGRQATVENEEPTKLDDETLETTKMFSPGFW